MRMILMVAVMLSGMSALADSSATGLLIKNFVVAGEESTLNIKVGNTDVALFGSVEQMQSPDGRITADCSKIGEVGLECEIKRDGGNGALASFKPIKGGYALASKKLVLTSGGDSFSELAEVQNSTGLSAEQVFAKLNALSDKSSTIEDVIRGFQVADNGQIQQVDARRPIQGPPGPPVGPPVVQAPGCCNPPGTSGVHTRHEEESTYIEKRRRVLDTYDSEISVPVVEEYRQVERCFDASCGGPQYNPCARCGPPMPPPCGGCGVGPAPLPAPCGYECGGPGVPPMVYTEPGYGYGPGPAYGSTESSVVYRRGLAGGVAPRGYGPRAVPYGAGAGGRVPAIPAHR